MGLLVPVAGALTDWETMMMPMRALVLLLTPLAFDPGSYS